MSETNNPISVSDEDPHSHHHAVLEALVLKGRGLMRGGRGIRVSFDGSAYVIEATAPPSTIARGGGLNLRGEWDPTATDYALDDMVVISMGINQGTFVYISATSGSAVAPYTGGGVWMALPGGLLGQWF